MNRLSWKCSLEFWKNLSVGAFFVDPVYIVAPWERLASGSLLVGILGKYLSHHKVLTKVFWPRVYLVLQRRICIRRPDVYPQNYYPVNTYYQVNAEHILYIYHVSYTALSHNLATEFKLLSFNNKTSQCYHPFVCLLLCCCRH